MKQSGSSKAKWRHHHTKRNTGCKHKVHVLDLCQFPFICAWTQVVQELNGLMIEYYRLLCYLFCSYHKMTMFEYHYCSSKVFCCDPKQTKGTNITVNIVYCYSFHGRCCRCITDHFWRHLITPISEDGCVQRFNRQETFNQREQGNFSANC